MSSLKLPFSSMSAGILLSLLTANLTGIFCSEANEGSSDIPKIAVIGGGIGGTATAFYLNRLFSPSAGVNVTLFELGVVGGRLATIKMAGHEYEVGGSIIHPKNKLIKDLVEELGLKEKADLDYLAGWQLDRFSLQSFGEVIFQQSRWAVVRVMQMLWRYGFWTLDTMSHFISTLISNFTFIYPFLESGLYVDDVSDLLLHMSPSAKFINSSILLNNTNISLMRRMLDLGMSKQLVDELAMAAVNTNYGQKPDGVHAMVGSVALAGAEGNLWTVEGGNRKVAEELLRRSGAHYVQAQVNSVTMIDDSTNFRVSFNRVDAPTEPDWLFNEGANEGKSRKVKVRTREEKEDFDMVVLATPMTKDKTTIKIHGLKEPPVFPRRYHRTVATLVNGKINPKGVGYDSEKEMTAVTLFIDKLDNLNSLSLLSPVEIPSGTDPSQLPEVWKVFSKTPLTEDDLDAMFEHRQETRVIDWLAYPHYKVQQRDSLGTFKLHDGLYYANAVEWAASAMEMAVIGGRNCANAAFAHWARLRGPGGPRCLLQDEDDDEEGEEEEVRKEEDRREEDDREEDDRKEEAAANAPKGKTGHEQGQERREDVSEKAEL